MPTDHTSDGHVTPTDEQLKSFVGSVCLGSVGSMMEEEIWAQQMYKDLKSIRDSKSTCWGPARGRLASACSETAAPEEVIYAFDDNMLFRLVAEACELQGCTVDDVSETFRSEEELVAFAGAIGPVAVYRASNDSSVKARMELRQSIEDARMRFPEALDILENGGRKDLFRRLTSDAAQECEEGSDATELRSDLGPRPLEDLNNREQGYITATEDPESETPSLLSFVLHCSPS